MSSPVQTADHGHVAEALAPVRAPLPRSYVLAWVVAAMMSGGYITTAALTGGSSDGASADVAASGASVRNIEIAEARAMKLKVTLEDFQRDVAALRVDLHGPSDAGGLLARLTALEERLAIETGLAVAKVEPSGGQGRPPAGIAMAAPPDAPAATASVTEAAGPSSSKPATRVAGAIVTAGPDGEPKGTIPLETGSLQKSPGRAEAAAATAQSASPVFRSTAAPVILNGTAVQPAGTPARTGVPAAPSSAPLTTAAINVRPSAPAAATAAAAGAGAVAAAATVAGAATAPPSAATEPQAAPARPFAVQLGAGGSVESLRLSWSVLADQHREALGGLSPRAARTAGPPGAPTVFDLLAGPFKTAADAKKACRTLAARGVDCRVQNYGGEAL